MNTYGMAACLFKPAVQHSRLDVLPEQASPKLVQLQRWLKEHAPDLLHQTVRPIERSRTGLPELDRQIGSVWPESGLVEWVRPTTSSGATALLIHLVSQQKSGLVAWVDCDQLDPVSCPHGLISRLLWVRAKDAMEVVRAGELLVQDGNFAWVVLDLGEKNDPARTHVPSSAWFRLGQVTRRAGKCVVVLTPRDCVGGARLRIRLGGTRTVEDIDTDFGGERVAKAKVERALDAIET